MCGDQRSNSAVSLCHLLYLKQSVVYNSGCQARWPKCPWSLLSLLLLLPSHRQAGIINTTVPSLTQVLGSKFKFSHVRHLYALNHLPILPYLLGQGFSLNLDLTGCLDWLSRKLQGSASLIHKALWLQMHTTMLSFNMGAGEQNSVLCLHNRHGVK